MNYEVIVVPFSREELKSCFSKWDTLVEEYHFPRWEQLPALELYMDQVLVLINQYLGIFNIVSSGETLITAAMINNYVKQGFMPPPQKKRYTRVHLAYLLMICTLKQTLNISTIQGLIPTGVSEDELSQIYNSFAHNQEKALKFVTRQVNIVSSPILANNQAGSERLNDFVLQVAVSANVCKTLILDILSNYRNENS